MMAFTVIDMFGVGIVACYGTSLAGRVNDRRALPIQFNTESQITFDCNEHVGTRAVTHRPVWQVRNVVNDKR